MPCSVFSLLLSCWDEADRGRRPFIYWRRAGKRWRSGRFVQMGVMWRRLTRGRRRFGVGTREERARVSWWRFGRARELSRTGRGVRFARSVAGFVRLPPVGLGWVGLGGARDLADRGRSGVRWPGDFSRSDRVSSGAKWKILEQGGCFVTSNLRNCLFITTSFICAL
jgi:hypothetical protein